MEKACLKKKDNLWVLFNGTEYVVGLTKEAQDDLGKITFASVPKVGQTFTQGETLIELEAEKAVNEYISPLTGVVSSVNEKIDEDVDVLNDDDELNAWIISLKDVDATQFDAL
ncbi:glycine cleavage system protein H [Enterococcus saccharolyticus]|uniref:Glycine cleavage H-protein n=1 Tax=Enterococcus saccharolyticus subsp. saccharolyticus ATCC 43076 TaxID=1139996 RepID=S0JDZ7_9ENTE|nr:glycine cleavage system protein H [Enterococcus saccharolyticus]EOT30492.1 glycine cleavage H-protein [Enterococcus saccharolyticus subsp. saccharolyticus ATCC 43076]EOT80053.1 glycine cleavage H-protein [Enterococcus saccharolyticus subsp. saccharolyticus ATCC 43076]OJG86487.1 glycine cleavage H-protein [Enterococcus saccharolyticus]